MSIKSSPNWGNSSQIEKLKNDFKAAKVKLRTSNSQLHIIAVNGCCYGRTKKLDKGDYFKYCGQAFWEFISGSTNLYQDIIEPLGYKAEEKNDEFRQLYASAINKLTEEFLKDFCRENREIDWGEIIRFNSQDKSR